MRPREIRRKLRQLRRRDGAARLASLSDALLTFAATGELPEGPVARAFVELGQAAQRAMAASVGGGAEHDEACRLFEERWQAWRATLAAYGAA
jgi:hypothetical protein